MSPVQRGGTSAAGDVEDSNNAHVRGFEAQMARLVERVANTFGSEPPSSVRDAVRSEANAAQHQTELPCS